MAENKGTTAVKDGALLVRDSKAYQALERQLFSLLVDDKIVHKFLSEAYFTIKGSDKLMRSTMHSLLCSIFEAASVGLSLSVQIGQAFLVPFQNNKKAGKPMEAKLIIGYKGYESLAGRVNIRTFGTCVFKKDFFEYRLGSHPEILHRPFIPSPEQPENRAISSEFMGAYATFTYPDGYVLPVFHDRQEIEKRRQRSKASEDGPWVTDYYAMALKCPIREGASKFIAHDFAPRLVEMATRDDLRSLGMPVGPTVLDTGKTTEEAASEITGEPPGTEDAGSAGAGEAPPDSETGPSEEAATNAFNYVEGKVLSAVTRGKIKLITLKTRSGEFQLSTFDAEHLRRAQELVNSQVRITYTTTTKDGKTYNNVARGAAIEAL